jgi:alpha-amylase/alpha-mannosidase (GH57 family)
MTASPLSVVIHGHFYQPPRDDPWLETFEAQPSAAPYHDWNERVEEECYRAVVAARVPGPEGRIAKIINALEHISFNFGPTLLEWMETKAPETYRSILEADVRSGNSNGGNGNAIAQAYHHTILPLASRREKVSEVRWGVADFRRRFRRDPVGMWLPETAVDGITLDVLAQEGIAFTIVAPHQVEEPPPDGLPGFYRTPGGRSVALFVYNGPLSHGVAFGSLLQDAEKWATDMVDPGRPPSVSDHLISVATDGETYGHHHRFGEMALAAVLDRLQRDPRARVENFSSFLSRHPAKHEVTLVEPSSWSCSHGVDRWRSDCGCKMHPSIETQQRWKGGLRDAVEWLAAQIHRIYETESATLLGDPWAARDRYGPLGESDTKEVRVLAILELERQVTSCGWFFDDLAGIEPVQVLRYAARALELTGPEQETLTEAFLTHLEKAASNETPPRSGRDIFLEEAKPRVPAYLRVAGGAALWSTVVEAEDGTEVFDQISGFSVTRLPSGSFQVTHRRTGRNWTVDARMYRPSAGLGAVAVRPVGEDGPFLPLELGDLPEDFRLPTIAALTQKVPDPGQALICAVKELGEGVEGPATNQIERVRDLADLHILMGLPIPFDAQTTFFRFLKDAKPEVAQRLAILRGPLGFTPAP